MFCMYKTDIQLWDIWGIQAAEKDNANCHKYATFEGSFLCFQGQKENFFFSKIL